MDVPNWILTWTAMTLAMMLPTAFRPARRIAGPRLGRWCSFISAYALIWMLCAIIGFPIEFLMPWNSFTLLIGWVLVGGYLMLPSTARNLRSCRSLARGTHPWRAGYSYGVRCAVACLPLMIVAMATMHRVHLPALWMMTTSTALAVFIMWTKHPSVPRTHLRTSGLVIVGSAALLVAFIPAPIAPAPHHEFEVVTR